MGAFETAGSGGTARERESRMMTGLFRDRESAEGAYRSLSSRGYGQDDVNLLMSDETRKKYFSDDDNDTELGTKAWEGAGKGAAIGGGVGATLAAIAAVGTTLALPGVGLLIAGFASAGAVLAADARQHALGPSLRAELDAVFGGFLIDTVGPGAEHDPVRVRNTAEYSVRARRGYYADPARP